MSTPRKRVTKQGRDNQRRREVLAQMHDAATKVEGVLRKGIAAHEMFEAMSKTPTRTWVRIGLQGLIRALEAGEKP